MKKLLLFAAVFSLAGTSLADRQSNRIILQDTSSQIPTAGDDHAEITSDTFSLNNKTKETKAKGNVLLKSMPYRVWSAELDYDGIGLFTFAPDSKVTTCTNDTDHLHWCATGKISYQANASAPNNKNGYKYFEIEDAWMYWMGMPVGWMPFFHLPLDTNTGWRFMPGYTSRWGGYLLSAYLYNIIGTRSNPNEYYLGGKSKVDMRTENGFAVGQSLYWGLKDLGRGHIKGYYAWDDDYDRYERHWTNSRHYNYSHWGSEVKRERYLLEFIHNGDLSERDTFSIQASYLSDSHMYRDFKLDNMARYITPVNELWYEHRENDYAGGVTVSGPWNDFYGGVARLPEGWVSVEPQPLWDLPVNYEMQTRAGYLNRTPAKTASADPKYRYSPYIGIGGRAADYQTFRGDTFHRVTLPTKFADAVSFVPRASYHGTWYSDSGSKESNYSRASGDAVMRNIGEFGFLLSGRATGWLDDNWRHTFEPYLDYSYQFVETSKGNSRRAYIFDAYDSATEWLDQFGFEGRGLPFNWHGIRPGIRNLFQERNEQGILQTILDTDLYAAVPFETYDYFSKDAHSILRGYAKDNDDGHYNRDHQVVPGFRARYNPTRDVSLFTRIEYDTVDDKFAYADIIFRHTINADFNYFVSYIGRDHRIWDYVVSDPNAGISRWDYELSNDIKLGFEHTVCDWLAWSPYIRFDMRRNELEEIGTWVDFLTDCIGYRFICYYESAYELLDNAKYKADFNCGFFIYLRALGASSGLDLAKF